MADYANIVGIQAPGALSDSSPYNIDGCCFAADGDGVLAGKIVTVKSVADRYKEITDAFHAGTQAYGVAFRNDINTDIDSEGGMIYLPGDPIGVISKGRVWALSQTIDMQPNFGDPVKVDTDGFAVRDGFEIVGWRYTGGWQRWGASFYIVEAQINQGAGRK